MKMKPIICGICISIAFRAKKPMEIEKTQNCLTWVKMKVSSYIHEFSLVLPSYFFFFFFKCGLFSSSFFTAYLFAYSLQTVCMTKPTKNPSMALFDI